MSSRLDSITMLVATGGALFCLAGCYDADKNFDDFVARDPRLGGAVSSDAAFDAEGCKRTLGNTQEFLITISPKPFVDMQTGNGKPNQMRATIEIVENDSMVLTAQSYHYDGTRTLVGEPTVTAPVPIRADGFFKTDVLTLDTPGTANCALPDTAVTVEVTLEGGQVCDDTTFACGVMNGTVKGLGVDLNGSTFTAQKIENNVVPAPVLNCDRVGNALPCK
jgi:hypothetical protein